MVPFITIGRVFSKSRNLAWASSKMLKGLQKKTTFRLMPNPDSGSGSVRGVSSIVINESQW